MENKFVGHCPKCSNKLIATRLACDKRELEVTENFELNKFDYFSIFPEFLLEYHENCQIFTNYKGDE